MKKAYWRVQEGIEKESKGRWSVSSDLLSEILSELFNEKYDTDEQRVQGIYEAIEFVTKVKVNE